VSRPLPTPLRGKARVALRRVERARALLHAEEQKLCAVRQEAMRATGTYGINEPMLRSLVAA
jgi:hypothetical protein